MRMTITTPAGRSIPGRHLALLAWLVGVATLPNGQVAVAAEQIQHLVRFPQVSMSRSFDVEVSKFEADKLGASSGLEGVFDGGGIDKLIAALTGGDELTSIGEVWTIDSTSASRIPQEVGIYAVKVPVVVKPEPQLEAIFDTVHFELEIPQDSLGIVEAWPKSTWTEENYGIDQIAVTLDTALGQGKADVGFYYKPVNARVISGSAGNRAFFTFQEVGGRSSVGQFDLIILVRAPRSVRTLPVHLEIVLRTPEQKILAQFETSVAVNL